ncbi:Hypothetical protein Tpal_1475 [Trichococcus palustris]|jgi:gas vesicle protein|uniref:YtxH domain-containing protein n=1 Tax=Trichococcus palustris TaxID=140314 RepID=A0A143YLJ8_9LACT|nr:YtxH domain-containing protein [Trichococcus palustris]CZQ91861.1 Hypothetical protein Tpal_1475 [Trichococcus palustris]SFL04402.1 Gas vesicle protein [Trichococcus palustris]
MRSFTEGLLFGAVVGGLVALLNTPNNGKENREKIKEYLDDTTLAVADLNESLNGLRESVNTLTNQGLAVATQFTDDVTKSVENFTLSTQPRINRINESLNTLTEDMDIVITNLESKLPETEAEAAMK